MALWFVGGDVSDGTAQGDMPWVGCGEALLKKTDEGRHV